MSSVSGGVIAGGVAVVAGGAAIVGVAALAIGAVVAFAGAILAVTGVAVTAAGAVYGGTKLAKIALHHGSKLAKKASERIAKDTKSAYASAHKESLALAKKEIEIKEIVLEKYRDSLADDKKLKADYFSTLIKTLDLELINVEKTDLEKKLKSLSIDSVHDYIDTLVNVILLVKNMQDLLIVLRESDESTFSKSTLSIYVDGLENFQNSLLSLDLKNLKVSFEKQKLQRDNLIKDIAASKKLKELKRISEKLEEISLEYTNNDASKPALIHILNSQLQTFQTTKIAEDDAFQEQLEKLELDKTVNELVYLIQGLPGEDFYNFKKLLDSMMEVDKDSTLDLRSKIDQIRRRRNLLQLRLQELKDKHTILLKNKEIFEKLTMINNLQRGKLELPLNAHIFNPNSIEKDIALIEKENTILTEKVQELIQAKATQDVLKEILKDELDIDFIQSSDDDNSSSELIESYHHLDNGVVLKVSTKGGYVSFKPMGVAIPGSKNDEQEVYEETKNFCDHVLPKIESSLKSRQILDVDLEKISPSLELVAFVPIEEFEDYTTKNRIKSERGLSGEAKKKSRKIGKSLKAKR
jgi:hypothetical protein